MYCYHCGYNFDEKKFEKKAQTRSKYAEQAPVDAEIQYVCPRCGHLIKHGHDVKDEKNLSIACHAELQRGRNSFAKGMCAISLTAIFAIIAVIFLLLSRKADIQYAVSTSCPEFWIFLVLTIISVALLVYGAISVTNSLTKKSRYIKLLKDINNKTFVQ